MLRDIIKKEILDNLISSKFVFTFILCTILILLSVYTGIANYQAEKREHEASVAYQRKGIDSPNGYEVLRSGGVRIFKPPQVLGTVVNGVEEAVGRVSSAGSAFESNLHESKYESNPLLAVFGILDLMFIVKIVLSLVAILFTYDAIVGEKESGTLKLALSNSIPRDRLILGKAIGGYICLIIPLLIPLVISLCILGLAPDLTLTTADWSRLFIILSMFFLYLSVFFILGLFISTRTSRSSTSLLVLLFIWVVFVTIIPKIAVIAADQIKPIPSLHEISAQKGILIFQAQQGQFQTFERRVRKLDPALEKDRQAYREATLKISKEILDEINAKINDGSAKIERDYQLKRNAQQSLAINLSRISPASALTFGSMTLARTGVDEYNRFLDSTRIYKPIFADWINSKRTTGPSAKIRIDDMPRHFYAPETLRESLVKALPDFASMIFMIILFFIGAYVSFLRYDVR
jgi:ABC-type transport system involved in multi-copper enzyme maturation permease subunit